MFSSMIAPSPDAETTIKKLLILQIPPLAFNSLDNGKIFFRLISFFSNLIVDVSIKFFSL